MYPYNHKKGQMIQTDIPGVSVDHAFLAHFYVPAAKCTAADSDGVKAFAPLGASAASIATGFTQPNVPRNLQVDCSVAGVTSNVKIYGTNYADEAIDETIALNGTTAVDGAKAFKSITKVDLPAQTHTPAKQRATIAVSAAASAAGTSVYTFTSAATGAAYDISCDYVAGDDSAAKAAVKLRAALNADTTFAAKWVAAGADANITIESLAYAAQDATINLTLKTAGDSNVTLGAITVDTVAGVATDDVSIGFGKKFGLPYKLDAGERVILKLFNNAADAGTVAVSASAVESNTYAVNGAPDGAKPLDLYIVV